jgi:hypothetical protein
MMAPEPIDDKHPPWVSWNATIRQWMATLGAIDQAGGFTEMTKSWPRPRRVTYLENLLKFRDAWEMRIKEFESAIDRRPDGMA